MKNIMKIFTTLEIANISAYVEKVMTDDQKKALGLKARYYFDKNMKKINGIYKEFEDYRLEVINQLYSEFFNDERSDLFYEAVLDDNGEKVLNDDGSEKTREMRKVKPEYLDEYNARVKDLDAKLAELLQDTNSVEVSCINLDEFVENLPDDTPIDIDCLNILSFMDLTTNVEGE